VLPPTSDVRLPTRSQGSRLSACLLDQVGAHSSRAPQEEVAVARLLNGGDVDEHVLAAVIRHDEPIAFRSVEPFHPPRRHRQISSCHFRATTNRSVRWRAGQRKIEKSALSSLASSTAIVIGARHSAHLGISSVASGESKKSRSVVYRMARPPSRPPFSTNSMSDCCHLLLRSPAKPAGWSEKKPRFARAAFCL
jgi:hypothetical protein